MPPWDHWLAFLIVGFAIGVAAGLLGIGGGVFVIPALVFLFGFSHRLAVGTSLAMLLPPIGIFALMQYWPAGVNLKAAILLACGFAAGGWVGGAIAHSHLISEGVLRRLFAFFMLYVAANMLFRSENRVHAAIKTALIVGGAAVIYALARLLGRRLERRLSLPETYRAQLQAPLAHDYEI